MPCFCSCFSLTLRTLNYCQTQSKWTSYGSYQLSALVFHNPLKRVIKKKILPPKEISHVSVNKGIITPQTESSPLSRKLTKDSYFHQVIFSCFLRNIFGVWYETPETMSLSGSLKDFEHFRLRTCTFLQDFTEAYLLILVLKLAFPMPAVSNSEGILWSWRTKPNTDRMVPFGIFCLGWRGALNPL